MNTILYSHVCSSSQIMSERKASVVTSGLDQRMEMGGFPLAGSHLFSLLFFACFVSMLNHTGVLM